MAPNKRAFRVGVVVLLCVLSACTNQTPHIKATPSPAVSSAADTPQPSTSSTTADLSSLKVHSVTGTAPAAPPNWTQDSDVERYTLDTLRYLVAAAQKIGLDASGLRFAVFSGDSEAKIDCKRIGHAPSAAKSHQFVVWCPTIDTLLVNAPAIKNPAATPYLKDMLYFFASAAGITLAGSETADAGRAVGLLYRAIGLQLQNMDEVGRKLDLHEFATIWWANAIVVFVRGTCNDRP